LEVDDKSAASQSLWALAFKNLMSANRKGSRRFNEGGKSHQLRVGDTVMHRKNLVSNKAHNVTAKMLMRWSEPLIISKFLNENNVLLVKPGTGAIVRKAHVSQLKRCVD